MQTVKAPLDATASHAVDGERRVWVPVAHLRIADAEPVTRCRAKPSSLISTIHVARAATSDVSAGAMARPRYRGGWRCLLEDV